MSLQSFEPTPTWSADAHESTVEALADLAADETAEVLVWGADWCGDCRSELPDLAAALAAAEFPDERVTVHEVDEDKQGDRVEEYGVEFIPTVVVERDGEELARFEEGEALPAARHLAEALREAGAVA